MCRGFSLDLQRLPGEERTHPDPVVYCERLVAMYERGLERLLSRPVWDREWYWEEEVVKVKGRIAVLQDAVRLCQAERDGETGLGSLGDTGRDVLQQLNAIHQTRPPD